MRAVIALGSNLGNRELNIDSAIAELAKIIEITHLSTNHETDPVVARFGRADLRGLHEGDALGGMAGRERIHDLAHVGRARRPVASRFGRGPRREPAVPVRPF